MGSIAMDNSGNMALGYSKSSAGIFPEIDVTGRLSGDALGTMGAEAIMKAGLGSQTGGLNRWGDYTAMAVDQRDGCTFWYTNQYQPANGSFNWSTRIASFRFGLPASRRHAERCQGSSPTLRPVRRSRGPGSRRTTGSLRATDASGRYRLFVGRRRPTPSTATGARRQLLAKLVASRPVSVNDGVMTLNFTLTGRLSF